MSVAPRRLRLIVAAVLLGLLASTTLASPAEARSSHHHHSAKHHHHKKHHGKKHHHKKRHSARPAATRGPASVEASIQGSVLTLINRERHAHGLRPVRMNSHLQLAALRHNRRMAGGNEMSHQLSGEADLGRRVDAAGYHWGAVGENIAWNSEMDRDGVLTLQTLMYNEQAPYDGHRRNILNRDYREVGVSVYFDHTNDKVWLTTDFGRTM